MAINVLIKSEPRSIAKGQFKCEIAADSVKLTQRKKQIVISVGTPAHYVGKNRVDVTLPDGRLQMTLSKFGTYQNRMAKDVASFLSGGGDPPVESDYSLPWFFYLLSVLPIGIPLITLGGAIPGAIGFGLAGACFGIAQKEEWSTTTRLLVAGVLVASGYIGLFALLAMAVAAKTAAN